MKNRLQDFIVQEDDDEEDILEKLERGKTALKNGRYIILTKAALALAAVTYCATIAGPETKGSRLAIHGIVLGSLIALRKVNKLITYSFRLKQVSDCISSLKDLLDLDTINCDVDDHQL